jgi:integrase
MTKIQIPNLHRFRNRHGKWQCYYRASRRTKIRLRADYLSPEFWAEYNAARANTAPLDVATRAKAGTFNAAIVGYLTSKSFADLGVSSQYTRRRILKHWGAEYGDGLVVELQQKHIVKMLGAKTPGAERDLWKSLRALLKFCVAAGLRDDNPSDGVRRDHHKSRPIRTVTEEEIEQYRSFHPIGSTARLAFELALYTGQRGPSDVTRLGWQNLKGGKLRFVQTKTKTEVTIPVHRELAAILSTTPRNNLPFLLTRQGASFTPAGFGNAFRDWCRAAGLSCSSHGLRKAMARRLIEAGCTPHEVMAILGLKTLALVQLYAAEYSREKAAEKAMAAIS